MPPVRQSPIEDDAQCFSTAPWFPHPFACSILTVPDFVIIGALGLPSDLKQGLTDPGSMALGAFPRSVEFIFMKGKATFSAFSRGNDKTIFRMLQAFHKMFDIVL